MNIAEILKYCSKGTKLYSLVDGEVYLQNICNTRQYCIEVSVNDYTSTYFTEDGKLFANRPNGECILFPSKEQRDWKKFRLPIKQGDVMMKCDGSSAFISNGLITEDGFFEYICGVHFTFGDLRISNLTGLSNIWTDEFCIPASKKVKKKLFDKIKEAGYKWNADTLELEKIEPKFKPFDKVLVRNYNYENWKCSLFSHYKNSNETEYIYVTMNGSYIHCIPYEGNEHILGKTINLQ